MENSQTPGQTSPEGESLEGSPDQSNAGTGTTLTPDSNADPGKKPAPKKKNGFFAKFSVYLLLFVLVVVVAVIVSVVVYLNGKAKPTKQISSQSLSQSSLSQLANSDVTVGDAKQVLNVQSNAVFAGQVLVRSDLQVAGKLQVGGELSLASINVAGNAIFGTAQVNQNLNVAGDTALQGQLTVQKGLNVNGSGAFNGPLSAPQIATNSLLLNGDLAFTHHVSAGGANPGRSQGSALGSGGTASVSGSDTAGSITINTGSGPSIGCLITVTFAVKFNATPHVVVSPVGAGAGGLGYYVNRTTSSFSVCTTSAPGPGETFGFDYIIFD